VEGRRSNAAVLREALAGQDRVVLPEELPAAAGCYHLLSLWCAGDRDAFIAKLVEAGLEPFIYIPTPLHRLARMAIGDYSGPRTFWHDQLKRAGVDYAAVSLPGAEERSRRTVELGFNWTEPNPEAMKDLGAILVEAAG
jgi:dTDP-4-amino-4,6-dideoxygalactose transaminase